ncbi:hypothetical protein [Shinella sp. M27]|uniref:hypothetical protein n=1 Tax=Shinella sp. M27 TaxID=3368614 RepID=UPI003BA34E21
MKTANLWQVEGRDGLLEDIGRVTVRWSAIDLYLLWFAELALRNREAATEIILNGSGAGRQRLEAFDRVIGASYFDEKERAELLGITGMLRSLLSERKGGHVGGKISYTRILSAEDFW